MMIIKLIVFLCQMDRLFTQTNQLIRLNKNILIKFKIFGLLDLVFIITSKLNN